MTLWTYATQSAGSHEWDLVSVTFDTPAQAADAASRWMLMAAQHGHWEAVRLERIEEPDRE